MAAKPTTEDAIRILREDAREGLLILRTIMVAADNLKSPEDIRKYFEAYVDVVQDAISRDIERGKRGIAVSQVKSGTPIRDVAAGLAYDQLRRVINHYNDEEVHANWNKALPELRTAGGLASIC